MNTGIGDAVNLAWKLSAVVRGRAAPSVLDSYEPERIAFARQLVATTDRLFRLVVSEGLAGQLYRTLVMPTAIPAATHFKVARKALFRTASQIGVHYPGSPLSVGKAGGVAGGDRLPWLKDDDNFAPLRSLDWRLHVYGDPPEALVAEAKRRGLRWTPPPGASRRASRVLRRTRSIWCGRTAMSGLPRRTMLSVRSTGTSPSNHLSFVVIQDGVADPESTGPE